VSDLSQATTWHPELGYNLPEGLLAPEDYPEIDESLVLDDGPVAGLISLGYIWAALRRRFWLWGILAVIGLLVGAGSYVAFPPPYQATVTVLLVDSPSQAPLDEIIVDTALATSTAVADGIVSQLGLQMTPATVLSKYAVVATTTHVITITAGAKTSTGALQLASAAATQFLKVRAAYEEDQQQATDKQLDQEVTEAQKHLTSVNSQLAKVSAEPVTTSQQTQLKDLEAAQPEATNELSEVQQYATGTAESTKTDTQSVVAGTMVLNKPVLAKRTFLKTAAFYTVAGLLAGLVIGLAIVIIGAITSDRLRRRDDIARAFGAPVRLSVGPLRRGRWPALRRGKAAVRRRDGERLVGYLRGAAAASPGQPASLAVVAVDDPETVAGVVGALALSSAQHGKQVVLADLSAGAAAARLLGAARTGSSTVSRDGVSLQVLVPSADDIESPGPLAVSAGDDDTPAEGSPAAAVAGADLLLSLVTLDPARGADYLPGWASDAVAVVTVGQSTGVRINAVGEMLRVAGMRRSSVVVVAADSRDESLGSTSAIVL
jgi:capsular polysaccharide biosynthesis protein